MSIENLTTMSLGVSSQKANMHRLFWQYQEVLAKGDAHGLAALISKASAEDSGAAIRFQSLYTGNVMDVPQYREGKGNGRHAGHPYFEMVEIEIETTQVSREKAKGKATLRSKAVETIRETVKAQNGLMYGKFGLNVSPIADSPNNVKFWRKAWHAQCLRDTGALDLADFAEFVSIAKLDKRTRIAESLKKWRTKSPAMLHAEYQASRKASETGTRSKAAKVQPEAEAQPVNGTEKAVTT